MNKYTVILESTVEELAGYHYDFSCEAEDADHAVEQALFAYPFDIIIDVELGDIYKTNANGEPIDRWNEHDLLDAERERIIEKLADQATESASQKQLNELYWDDQRGYFSGLSDEELLNEIGDAR